MADINNTSPAPPTSAEPISSEPYREIDGYTRQRWAGWRPHGEMVASAPAQSAWTQEDSVNLTATLSQFLYPSSAPSYAPPPVQNASVQYRGGPVGGVQRVGLGVSQPRYPLVSAPRALTPQQPPAAAPSMATPAVSRTPTQQGPNPAYQGQRAVAQFRLIRNEIDSTTLWVTVKRRSVGAMEIVMTGFRRRSSTIQDRYNRARICLERQGQESHGRYTNEALIKYIRDLNAVHSPTSTAATAEAYGRVADAVLDCVILDASKFGLDAKMDTSGRVCATIYNFQLQRSALGATGPAVFGQAVLNLFYGRLINSQQVEQRFVRYALNDDEKLYRQNHDLHNATYGNIDRTSISSAPPPMAHPDTGINAGTTAPMQALSTGPGAIPAYKVMSNAPTSSSTNVPPQAYDTLPAWHREIYFRNILEPTMALTIFRDVGDRLIVTVCGYARNQPFDGPVQNAVNTALKAQGRASFDLPPAILSHQGPLAHWRTKLSNVAGGALGLLAFGREATGLLYALGQQHPQIKAERGASGLITLTLTNIRLPADFVNKAEWNVRKSYNNWQGRFGEQISLNQDEVYCTRFPQRESPRMEGEPAAFPTNRSGTTANRGVENAPSPILGTPAPVVPQEAAGMKRKLTDSEEEGGQHKAQKHSQNQTPGQFLGGLHDTDIASSSAVFAPASLPSQFTHPRATVAPLQENQGLKRKFAEHGDQDIANKVLKRSEDQTPTQAVYEDRIQAQQSVANADTAPSPRTAPALQLIHAQSIDPSTINQANNGQGSGSTDDAGKEVPSAAVTTPVAATDEAVDLLPEIVDDDLFGDGDLDDDLFGDGDSLLGDVNKASQAKNADTMPPPGLALPQPPRVYPGLALPRMVDPPQASRVASPISPVKESTASERTMEQPAARLPASHAPFNFNATSTTVSPAQLQEAEAKAQKAKNKAAYEKYCAECEAQGVSPETKVAERILNTEAPNAAKKVKDTSHPTVAAMIKWCAGGQLSKHSPKAAEMRAFLKAGPQEWRAGIYHKGFVKAELQDRINDLWSSGTLRKHMDLPDGSIVEDPTKSEVSTGGQGSTGLGAQTQYGMQNLPQGYAPVGQGGYTSQASMATPGYGQAGLASQASAAMPGYGQTRMPQQPLPYGASYAADYGAPLPPSNLTSRNIQTAQSPIMIDESDTVPATSPTPAAAPVKKARKSRAKAKANTNSDSALTSPKAKKARSKKGKMPIWQLHGFPSAEAFDAHQNFLLNNNNVLGKDGGNEVDADKDERLNAMAREAALKVAPRPTAPEMQRRDSGIGGMGMRQVTVENESEEE